MHVGLGVWERLPAPALASGLLPATGVSFEAVAQLFKVLGFFSLIKARCKGGQRNQTDIAPPKY